MRRKLVAANWKLNGSLAANAAWLEGFMPRVKDVTCDVAVAAPSVYLTQLAAGFAGSAVIPAAEDVSLYDAGAYTGEVAAAMLRDVGVKAVIVGHSEQGAGGPFGGAHRHSLRRGNPGRERRGLGGTFCRDAVKGLFGGRHGGCGRPLGRRVRTRLGDRHGAHRNA